MAKQIYNEPIDMTVDWGGDESTNNLPVSGEMVQKFIKDTLNEKFGYGRVVGEFAQFFATEENAAIYDSDPINNTNLLLGRIQLPQGGGSVSQQYYVRTENNLDSRNFAVSVGKVCNIMFTYMSEFKPSPEMPYENTGERGFVQVFARLKGREYEEVTSFYCVSGEMYTLDVSSYLVSGDNDIMLRITGEETLQSAPALTYGITLTSLSISANNFQWWKPFTGDITIPFSIGGNIDKILKVDVVGVDGEIKSYEVPLGKSVYIESAYGYTVKHPDTSGVYKISAYVQNTNGSIKTDVVEFNVICINEGDKGKYFAVNSIDDELTNWSDNIAFYYSMYDGGKTTTDVIFDIYKGDDILNVVENGSVTTGTKNAFNIPLELDTVDNSDFEITVIVKDNDAIYYEITFNTDNSLSYSAMPGAVFYMNPKTRNNSQSNRNVVINEMTGDEVPVTWKNIGWDSDAWSSDEDGNKCLRLYAGSEAVVKYKPFEKEGARNGKTIELDFCIRNVSDESASAINIMSNDVGLKITPNEIKAFSLVSKNEDTQTVNIQDAERTKVTYVIMPNAYGNEGFNLCFEYVNAVKNRTFVYQSNDYFYSDADITLGCTGADMDVYGIRVYDTALSSAGVLSNHVNWEVSIDDRNNIIEKNDVFNSEGSDIDFYKIKDKLNCFVFSGDVPSYTNKKVTGKGDLEVFWAEHPEWNSIVKNILAEGQGTSSKKYFKWNLRWKFEKDKFDENGVQISWATVVEYVDGTTEKGKWRFVPGKPKIKKATAKLNWASSMQSHKIGGVNSITELAELMGLKNEANARISVYQYPFVGFSKSINEEGEVVYKFLGLYTFGPDKGDDDTFGYDDKKYPDLISVEGADNAPLAALFRVPWKDKIVYDEEEESFRYNGENSWDFNAGSLDKIGSFINAYNFVYECSPRIKPFDGTLDELNLMVEDYKGVGYDFWLSDENGSLVYYEASEKKYIYADTGKGAISLKEQLVDKGYEYQKETTLTSDNLAKDLNERNKQYISARVNKFRKEMQNYWDLNDSIFARNWTEFNAATDNRAKNTYPYTFNGVIYKWRHDDVDTVWPINNQGQSSKGYWVELHDTYDNGGPVWNGETSNFWNLLDMAFPEEVIKGAHAYMDAMCELGGVSKGNSYDKIYGFFKKYYFDNAQEYFCQSLYNTTAKELYETAKIAMDNGSYTNDTDPITQSLGDHYSAERRWISKRIPYMMSKYAYGDFSNGGNDAIIVRAAGGVIGYDITPAIWMYPCVANGTSLVQGNRTPAGETCHIDIDLAGSADQQNAILGANYLKDIGNWHDKNVSGTMSVTGKMLTELKIGHKTENIVISIDSLVISNTPALQMLMLSRVSTLKGTLDLSGCKRLSECYLDGTGITQPKFAVGGGLKKVEFGSDTNYVIFKNMPMLTNDGVNVTACRKNITDFGVTDCVNMQPVTLLYSIYSQQKKNMKLKRIRCVGFDEHVPNEAIDMIYMMSLGDFNGMDSEGIGTSGIPVFEGKISVDSAPKRILDILAETYPQLEITCKNIVRPTGYNVTFTSPRTFYENQTIQLVAVSSNPAYPEIKYAIIDSGDYSGYVSIDEWTGLVTLTKPYENVTFNRYFEVRAYSTENPDIYSNVTINITGIEVSTINIITDGLLSNGDNLSVVFGPTTHTKTTDVIWSTNDNDVFIDDKGKVTVSTDEIKLVNVKATYALDTNVYTEKICLVNDGIIADITTNPELVNLAYIASWSSSNKEFKASEAYKVTTLGTSLQNSGLKSFEEFVYFGNVSSLSDNFRNCNSLKRLIIPEHIKSVSRLNNSGLINLDYLEVRTKKFSCYGTTNMTIKEVVLYHDVADSDNYPIVGVEHLEMKEGVTVSPVINSDILKVVDIPSTLIDVKGYGHYNNNSSFDIQFNIVDGSNVKVLDGLLVDLDETTIYKCNDKNNLYEIPNNYKRIGNYAFSCVPEAQIVAHDDIQVIGKYAFYNSTVSITNINSASDNAFEKSILSINNEPLRINGEIGKSAFKGCQPSTTDIYINCKCYTSSFAEISYEGANVYLDKNVTVEYDGSMSQDAITFINCKLHYNGSIEQYMQTKYIGCITTSNDLYINNSIVTNVMVSASVKGIADYAFAHSNIESVQSSHPITIGNRAFYKSSIISIEGVADIGEYAFASSSISEIFFNGCSLISQRAFANTEQLKNVVVAEGVTNISNYGFYNSGIEYIELPKSLTNIGNYAFDGCWNVHSFKCKALSAPSVQQRTFGNYSYMGRDAKTKTLYIPIESNGYDQGNWSVVTDRAKANYKQEHIYNPIECTNLSVIGDNVPGYDSYTTLRYTAITNGYDPVLEKDVVGYVITGKVQSDDFGQNPSYEESRTIELSFEYMGVVAVVTIEQGPNSSIYYRVNLNDEWRLNENDAFNPDSSEYDGMYESFINYGIDDSTATMYIEFFGYEEFSVLIRSHGESAYDYVSISEIDKEIDFNDASTIKATTKDKASGETSVSSYTTVTYFDVTTDVLHRISIIYKKDTSGTYDSDRGFVLIPKNQ